MVLSALARNRAKERLPRALKGRRQAPGSQTSATETQRLVQELHVHQLELETQNEELRATHARLEAALAQYTELYEFAPACYFTLGRDGTIRRANLTSARWLGIERSRLLNRRFAVFLAAEARSAFAALLARAFETKVSQSGEVTLKIEGKPPLPVALQARATGDSRECLLVLTDLTSGLRRLAAIVESSDSAIISKDLCGTILTWNPGAERMFGYRTEEVVGHNIRLLIPKDRRAEEAAILGKIRKGEPVEQFATLRRKKDGTLIPVLLMISPVRDAAGKVVGASKIARDITQRTEAQEALRKRDAILQAINEGTTDVICVKDREGKIVMANPAMCRLLGKSESELLGKDDLVLLSNAEQTARIRENDRRIMKTRRVEAVEEKICLPNRWQTYLFTKSPYLNASGEVIGLIGIGVDITERKQTEEALRKSEEQFRAIFNTASVGIAQADPQTGQWVQVNEKMCAITGYSAPELLKLRVPDITHPDDRKADWDAFQRVVRGEAPDYRMEKRYVRKDGTLVWVNVNMTVIRNETGEPTRTLGVIEDITERRQAEENLRMSEERLRVALEASNAGTWSWDVAGSITKWDERYHAMYGFEPGDPTSLEAWMDRVHPEDRQRLQARIGELLKSGPDDSWDEEFRILHPVKGERWMAGVGRVGRDCSGRAVCLVGINLDITERKRLQEEREINVRLLHLLNGSNNLHELMRQVTLLLHEWFDFEAVGIRLAQGKDFPYFETRGLPAAFVRAESQLCLLDAAGQPVCDPDGNPVLQCMCRNVLCGRFDPAKPFFTARGSFWSNGTTDLLASTTDADRQAGTRNRCNGEGYESVALVALRVGQTTYGLLQINDKRKDRFTPQRIAVLERLADNLAVGVAHRQGLEALRESEERYRAVVEDQTEVICRFKADGTLEFINEAFCRLFGKTSQELLGRPFQPEVMAEDVPVVEAKLRTLSSANPVVVVENRVHAKDGSVRWMQFVNRAFFDAEGRRLETQAVGRDITERKRAEESLRQSRQQLRALTSRVERLREEERTRISREIHDELGQMLTGIKMDLRWMEHCLEQFGEDRRVNLILDKLVATAELTDATAKAVQRIAAELRPGILDKLGLPMALQYEADRFEERTGIACRLVVPGEELAMRLEATTAFFRIFQEALTNVTRHAKATAVEAELQREADGWRLEVRDNGQGMARVDLTKETSLGLLGMQERAALLGGGVTFAPRPDGGTVVTVRIPNDPAHQGGV